MRIRQNVAKLLERCGIPQSHAVILQGQKTRLTGFSTDLMAECEFPYRILGSDFMADETFAYLIPYDALEAA